MILLNISILTEHSLWWLLPIVMLVVVLAYGQYFYKNTLKNDLSSTKILTLASLRALVYIGLLFLLLNPNIKYSQKRIEKPLLIWAQDNSQSLKLGKDSVYYQTQYIADVDAVLKSLSQKYKIQKLGFGEEVKTLADFDFTDQSSDYASLFSYLKNNIQPGQQTQLILAGDGLYNKGNDARFLVQEVKCPVHTIALGDAASQKDLSVVFLRSNKLAFLKSNTPVRLGIKADFCEGEEIFIQLDSDSETLYLDTLTIPNASYYVEKDFFITPQKSGLQKYRLSLKAIKGESNLKNNKGEMLIDVLDSKRKIAICYDTYHPDIAALYSALEEQSNTTIRLIDVSKKQVDFSDFNLMIFYQLPSMKHVGGNFLNQLTHSRVPFMMILGGASDFNLLNRLNLGLKLDQTHDLFQNARMAYSDRFSLFEMDEEDRKAFSTFPPLMSPMGKYSFNQESHVMGTQIVKAVGTEMPLIAFSQRDDQKQAYILGEGLWRWKLQDYKMNQSHEHFNALMNRMVQYLALKVKRNQLTIQYDKVYKETDAIRIEAQLYDESYQTINKADLNFLLKNDKDEAFAYQFERSGKVYNLDLNNLPAGNYQFEAKVKAFDQEFAQKGSFVVRSENLESKQIQANPAFLKDLSELSGALHFPLSKMPQLADSLLANKNIKARISVESHFRSVLNFMWVLCFIIILLSLEWFLKKYWLGI